MHFQVLFYAPSLNEVLQCNQIANFWSAYARKPKGTGGCTSGIWIGKWWTGWQTRRLLLDNPNLTADAYIVKQALNTLWTKSRIQDQHWPMTRFQSVLQYVYQKCARKSPKSGVFFVPTRGLYTKSIHSHGIFIVLTLSVAYSMSERTAHYCI